MCGVLEDPTQMKFGSHGEHPFIGCVEEGFGVIYHKLLRWASLLLARTGFGLWICMLCLEGGRDLDLVCRAEPHDREPSRLRA